MHSKRADNHTWRTIKSGLASTVALISALLVIAPLGLVFFHLLVNGASSVNWDFFTKLPTPVGTPGGGMVNAIVGSLELLAFASIIGIPIGVLGGVYLGEYGSARVNSVLRFIADVLNGVPSITWGVVVYGLVVLRFKGFSAYAGGLALGLIMIPLILRTTEEVILLVPNGYREAALALGVSSCMRLSARRKVDFPQPLGPMIAVTAFEATPRVTLSMARFSPYQIERFFTSNVHAAGVSASGGGAVPCSIRSITVRSGVSITRWSICESLRRPTPYVLESKF